MLPQLIVGRREAQVEWSTRSVLLPPLVDGAFRSCLPWWTWLVTPCLCWAEWAGVTGLATSTGQWDVQAGAFTYTSSVSRSICTQNYYSSTGPLAAEFQMALKAAVTFLASFCGPHRGHPTLCCVLRRGTGRQMPAASPQVRWEQHPELPAPL